jgi:pyruvate kinase
VNLPGLDVLLPAMSAKDKEDIRWGIEHDIDFIAASFTRKASDIREIRTYVSELMSKYHAPGMPHPQIIAKIESIEALRNFDEILQETDAVMVARVSIHSHLLNIFVQH